MYLIRCVLVNITTGPVGARGELAGFTVTSYEDPEAARQALEAVRSGLQKVLPGAAIGPIVTKEELHGEGKPKP